jgi:diguanylate cyclase (GGDEF)-like protein
MMTTRNQYAYMFHSLACGICRVALDDSFTLLYANPFYYHIYGYTPQSAMECGFDNVKYILSAPVFHRVRTEALQHVKKQERFFELEFQGVHRNGEDLWLLVRCTYDPEDGESILCVLMDIAVHKQLEDQLRMSMEESRMAFQLTDKLMYSFDIEECRLTLPPQISEDFDLPQIMYGVPMSIVNAGTVEKDSIPEFIRFYNAMLSGEPHGYSEVKKCKKDGTCCWYAAKYSMIYDKAGKAKRAIISCEDITKQKEKEFVYSKWRQYFKTKEGKTIGYYEYDLTLDRHMEGVGDTPPEYLKTLKRYTDTVPYIAEHFVGDEDRERFYRFFDRNRLLTLFYDGQDEDVIEYRRIEQETIIWVRASLRMAEDPTTGHIKMFMMTMNIDAEKKKTLRLQKLVETDEMTGLLKRETFIRKVNDCLKMQDYVIRHAFLLLDIDEFKQQNDTYGHQFGDQVIRDTAELLKSSLRKQDICGRLGGDEFMVFLNGVSSQERVLPRIQQLCEKLHREYAKKGSVSCSIGVAFYPQNGTDFEQLYHNADIALYEAKRAGRSNYKLFQK